ncbi:MAG: Atg14 domain-containing protein [Clostridium sp.]|nr:Atg14 domain-containing protein [Acetatifactor muris]MCM1527852.1 Atg14 domain-containing protein [Bacteroides sp.]MCM1563352.1 Atg14 domain-containing protein [Clostridium sp.]
MGENGKRELFSDALLGKKIPILTLDNKWYRLLDEVGKANVKDLENRLNDLLKRQGKLTTEAKDVRKLKKKLMSEIVPMVNEMEQSGSKKLEKKIGENKRLIEECNEKIKGYKEELAELPAEIERVNEQLMLATMEYCYGTMKDNSEQIRQIDDWVTGVRIELKKNLIRKQMMEKRNQDIYSYMNDIFGGDVVDLFDIQYNPEEHFIRLPKSKDGQDKTGGDGAGN